MLKLPNSQQLILKFLSDGKLHNFRDIVIATGKYSNLPGELRNRHPRSLGSKGMVREIELKIGNETVFAFQITAVGYAEVNIKPKSIDYDAAVADFTSRYQRWLKDYKIEEETASKIGLRRNQYLLLRALGDAEELTFSQLVQASGIYSGLVQDLRSRHARHRSLASLGLIVESYEEHENPERTRPIFTFRITKAGLKALEKAKGRN